MMKFVFLFCCALGCMSTINAEHFWDIKGSIDRFIQFRENKNDLNDHLITFDEFKKFGKDVFTRSPEDEAEWRALYDVYDISDNQQVDIREFVICDSLHTEFKRIDGNGDGVLSNKELLGAIDINDPKLSIDKVTFLEYYARVFTDEKLVGNWRDNVGLEFPLK